MSIINGTISQPAIWLGSSLASHRRGRILKTTVNAQPAEKLPPGKGICLVFGSDFQQANDAGQHEWINWSQAPGRVLLLIPPFKSQECTLPKAWEARRRADTPTAKDNDFLMSLAPEAQSELKGQWQIAQSLGGTWDDLSLCTIYYRQHPHSGIFAITCLPLWSLVVLDWSSALQEWLSELDRLAGNTSAVSEPIATPPTFLPSAHHFTVLLHLLTASFPSDAAALAALQQSPIFSLESTLAAQCLQELQTHNLVSEAHLTPAGQQILAQSHYAPYAEELEALAP
jgi:hypothetical protein